MARSRGNDGARGNDSERSRTPGGEPAASPSPESARLSPIPELMRRLLSVGLSGFFLTEEAIRKALGDTLPRDWTDFAIEQSERTRKEFLERLSFEMARSFENVDFAAVLRDLLEGRTLEINAEVRLAAEPEGSGPAKLRVGVSGRDRKR